jgi:outer membrane receptor protein involved in Fe transport
LTAVNGSTSSTTSEILQTAIHDVHTGIGVPEDKVTSPFYSGFVQDNFRVASNLSVNFGLRYEFEHLDGPVATNPQLRGQGDSTGQKQFCAALALAWQPSPKFVVEPATEFTMALYLYS